MSERNVFPRSRRFTPPNRTALRAGRRLGPARLGTVATPTADGTGYVLNGLKLWPIADIVVALAQVPKHDGGRGGISAFVLLCDNSDGTTVEHRNAFMGYGGSRTR